MGKGKPNPIPAGQVAVGDSLIEASGKTAVITTIETVHRVGLYAPFTPTGTLVVDGFQVSSFVTLDESRPAVTVFGAVPMSWHWLAHTFEFPHRIACHYLAL